MGITNLDSLTLGGDLVVGGSETITGGVVYSGNVTLGDTSADAVDVNGTSQFDAPVTVGVNDTGHDVKLFGATSGKSWLWDESADKMIVTAASDLLGATQQTGTLTVGVNDTGYDVTFFGATSGKSWLWDESADKMIVTGATDLLGATQQTGTFTVGVDDTGHDVKFYGATAGKYMLWDESADLLSVVGGTAFSGNVSVGIDDTGFDVVLYGATSGKYFMWDESADKVLLVGDASLNGTITIPAGAAKIVSSVSNTTADFTVAVVQQAITGSGAITLTEEYTTLNTTGGGAYTFADSTVIGQKKKIQMIVDAGDGTVTFNGTSTIVFADVGDVAELIWDGSNWIPTALYNIVDGATAPVYTP